MYFEIVREQLMCYSAMYYILQFNTNHFNDKLELWDTQKIYYLFLHNHHNLKGRIEPERVVTTGRFQALLSC